MKIEEGEKQLDIELCEMKTDKTFTYWDSKSKSYVKADHIKVLPKSHFLLAVIGRAGSGKSSSVCSWFSSRGKNSRVYRGCFDRIYFICNSTSMSSMKNSPWKDIPEEQMWQDFNQESLEEVFECIRENSANNMDSCIIIDDCVNKTRTCEAEFANMCLVHRHFKFSVVLCLQDAKMLSPQLRNNFSGVLLFRNENKIREKIIRDEWLSFLTQEEFSKFCKYVWRNHGDSLYVSLRDHPIKLYRNFKLLSITGYESEVV